MGASGMSGRELALQIPRKRNDLGNRQVQLLRNTLSPNSMRANNFTSSAFS
jgi:hypothetical protein